MEKLYHCSDLNDCNLADICPKVNYGLREIKRQLNYKMNIFTQIKIDIFLKATSNIYT